MNVSRHPLMVKLNGYLQGFLKDESKKGEALAMGLAISTVHRFLAKRPDFTDSDIARLEDTEDSTT